VDCHDGRWSPVGNEFGIRYSDWEYGCRQVVEEMGEGAIGYVHLRAMGSNDITQWYREFYPVFNRQGLIIDVRHNRGGNIDAFILEKLLRRPWMYWKGRVGQPTWNMHYAFRGHMVVLVDQNTASDGEAFADGFRRLGLGEVIGLRTWGGEIWLSSSNRLSDGGLARAPMTGVYGPEGEWLIEQIGVVPDVEVDNLPHATFKGEDAQLDAAIAHLLQKIEQDPRPVPPPPPYPNRGFRYPVTEQGQADGDGGLAGGGR
jgi:tricorn protease